MLSVPAHLLVLAIHVDMVLVSIVALAVLLGPTGVAVDVISTPTGHEILCGAKRLHADGRSLAVIRTEAAGQDVNLRERCADLIHIDLPWNLMRLHQRVDRLSRYGQTRLARVICHCRKFRPVGIPPQCQECR